MNDAELKKMWEESNIMLQQSIIMNQRNAIDISQLKAYNFLSSMKPLKIISILTGLIWVGFGITIIGYLCLYSFEQTSIYFLLSASFQVGLTAIALIVYFYQFITIYNLDLSDTIIKTQEKIAKLKNSTLWVTRVLFLQLPAWTTFWWNEQMFNEWETEQWMITVFITLVFTYAAVWLFLNIKYENKDKKWFRFLFSGQDWTPLMQSTEVLSIIEEFKEDKTPAGK